jgi:hypothetical protein
VATTYFIDQCTAPDATEYRVVAISKQPQVPPGQRTGRPGRGVV